MLLIDDDQPQIRKGQEQRRARADDHANVARRAAAPDARAFARPDAGMPLGGLFAETVRETLKKLSRERDFRHHDERLSACLQRLGDRLEIDLGFA